MQQETLGRYINYMREEKHFSPVYVNSTRTALMIMYAKQDLLTLNNVGCVDLIKELTVARNWKRSTQYQRALDLWYYREWAVDMGILSLNDFKKGHFRKPQYSEAQSFEPEEIPRAIYHWNNTIQESVYFTLLADCGFRISELVNLNIEDISFAQRIIQIKRGKGGRMRNVPYTRKTKRLLTYYLMILRSHGRFNGPLFIDKSGERITRSKINNKCAYASRIRNVKLYPHKLRHSYAAAKLNEGMELTHIQQNLGHKDISTTANLYLHHSKKQKVKALDKVEHTGPLALAENSRQ